ncbi:MAG: CBS domain-containing protein [Bacteriovoracaceae bacterium]
MKKSLRVIEFSSPFLVSVEKDADLTQVMSIMTESDIRHIPVTDNDELVGIISERDLRVFENREFATKFQASDIMVEHPYCVNQSTDLRDVVEKMVFEKYGSCLIQNDSGELVGIFTIIDALRTLNIILAAPEKGPSVQVLAGQE